MNFLKRGLLVFAAAMILQGSASAAFFTAGNLVIDQVGTGASALTSSATQTNLVQYTTAGVMVNSLAITNTASGNNYALTNSGTATSEGALSLSSNGQYLAFAGYNATLGTASVASTSSTAVARVVGLVDASGNINTSTAFNDGYNGNNIRSASTADGTTIYTAGTASSANTASAGVREVTVGATSSTSISTAQTNVRNVEVINGQVYVSSGSGSNVGVNAVGTGTPTTGGQTTTLITPAAGTSPYGFVILGNNLYVADSTAGLEKFTFSGGAYTLVSTTATGFATGLTGLTGTIGSNGDDLLYGVSPTQLVAFDDNGTTINSTILATASTNTAFRGVAFAPSAAVTSVPEPASIAMTALGVCFAGAIAARRNRRRSA